MLSTMTQRNLGKLIQIITICIITLPAHAKYSGGSGEPNNPYQIASAEDIITLGQTPEDYNKNFILTEDIDMAPS